MEITAYRHRRRVLYASRASVTKYLVQWDKEDDFRRSYIGGETSHADAARWSAVVNDTKYQASMVLSSCSMSFRYCRLDSQVGEIRMTLFTRSSQETSGT